jgi:hypothetical protein
MYFLAMMKKTSPLLSLCSLVTAFAVLVISSSACFAQEQEELSHVDNVLEDLNAKEAQAQAELKPLQATSEVLKSEAEKIKALAKQNETMIAALKDPSVPLTLKAFEELVTNINSLRGKCQITQSSTNSHEFIVATEKVKIRFLLANEESEKKPIVKKALVNGVPVIHYEQPGWSDKSSTAETFRSVIETSVKTSEKEHEEILRLTFNGETVDDRNFFAKLTSAAPPAETPITCILLN